MMFKLLITLSLAAFATSACVDKADCSAYANFKDVYCSHEWLKIMCRKFCSYCTDGGDGDGGSKGDGKCGQQLIPMSRVVGGKDAVPGSWPWQISMVYRGTFICGGTLVNSKWIVTASHCVDRRAARDFTVVLGDHNRSDTEGVEQRIAIKRIIMHPQYNKQGRLNNDIALMELAKPAMFTNRVQPACLPKQGEKPAVGIKCYITGWGKIQHPGRSYVILQQLELTVQSQSACNAVNSKYMPITNQMVCGANPRVSKNQAGCHGDSGGPFVCQQSDGSWKLQGAVSWGSPKCDSKDSYTVFARVAEFRNWMDQYINV